MRSCSHIEDFKASNGVTKLRGILSLFLFPASEKARAIKERYGYCLECKSTQGLQACASCQYVACEGAEHFKPDGNGKHHFLAVSLTNGNLYCHVCRSYIYDADVEAALCCVAARGGVKRTRRWLPDERQAKILRQSHATVLYVERGSTLGLRGICNMGNTCYMSSVLQALAHAPVLREYFLSGKQHKCRGPRKACPVHRFTDFFQEFYSGKSQPFAPAKLLRLVWTQTILTGNQQQDAHEFLIAFLTLVHDHLTPHDENSPGRCNSIVDLVFKGYVQSTVTCSKCLNTSPTVEMFWDLSLELPSPAIAKVKSSTPATAKTFRVKTAQARNKSRVKNRRKNGKFAPSRAVQAEKASNTPQSPPLHSEAVKSLTNERLESTSTKATNDNCTASVPVDVSPIVRPSRRPSLSLSSVSKQPLTAPSTPSSAAAHPRSSLPCTPSLPISSPPHSPPMLSPTLTLPALVNSHSTDNSQPQSLVDCLKRYTRKEHLGSEAKIFCETCQSSQECSKQLRMFETPPVICFHLKRFEQLQLKKKQKKIATFVEFPETLDMTEFMAERENQDERSKHPQWNIYSLFAVVVHKGELSQGHYTCFVRQQKNEWYKCDDSLVTPASLDEVLNSESYLLLYHRVIMLSDERQVTST